MDKQLTKAEEQLMQVLWELDEASVQDIINQLPEPKPAYNTVSTIIRILETKDFVSHKAKGRGHIYPGDRYTQRYSCPRCGRSHDVLMRASELGDYMVENLEN